MSVPHWIKHRWRKWRVVCTAEYIIWQERECVVCGIKERRQTP